MSDPLDAELARVKSLSPEARLRIAESLRSSIQSEVGASPVTASAFSRGVIFSRSSDTTRLREAILPELMAMDDARFAKFAQRIATLKQTTGESG